MGWWLTALPAHSHSLLHSVWSLQKFCISMLSLHKYEFIVQHENVQIPKARLSQAGTRRGTSAVGVSLCRSYRLSQSTWVTSSEEWFRCREYFISPEGRLKPNHPNGHPVSGCSISHTSFLLHVSDIDIDHFYILWLKQHESINNKYTIYDQIY